MAERTAASDATARRFRLGSPRAWARALGVLAVLSFAAAVPLSLLSHQLDSGVIAAVIGVPCAAVGWLVTRRQPGNPIGWLSGCRRLRRHPELLPRAGTTAHRPGNQDVKTVISILTP